MITWHVLPVFSAVVVTSPLSVTGVGRLQDPVLVRCVLCVGKEYLGSASHCCALLRCGGGGGANGTACVGQYSTGPQVLISCIFSAQNMELERISGR